MKNKLHNSSEVTSKKDVLEIILDKSIWVIRIIIRIVFKIISLVFSIFKYIIEQTTNKLKPHFYRFEELLYSRAKDLFGV